MQGTRGGSVGLFQALSLECRSVTSFWGLGCESRALTRAPLVCRSPSSIHAEQAAINRTRALIRPSLKPSPRRSVGSTRMICPRLLLVAGRVFGRDLEVLAPLPKPRFPIRRCEVSLATVKTIPSGLLNEAVERLKAEFQPEQIFLFGSHAWADAS